WLRIMVGFASRILNSLGRTKRDKADGTLAVHPPPGADGLAMMRHCSFAASRSLGRQAQGRDYIWLIHATQPSTHRPFEPTRRMGLQTMHRCDTASPHKSSTFSGITISRTNQLRREPW